MLTVLVWIVGLFLVALMLPTVIGFVVGTVLAVGSAALFLLILLYKVFVEPFTSKRRF